MVSKKKHHQLLFIWMANVQHLKIIFHRPLTEKWIKNFRMRFVSYSSSLSKECPEVKTSFHYIY